MNFNDRLDFAIEGQVATVTLNRAPVNAIDDALLSALDRVFDGVEADTSVNLLRIRSNQKVFCAGSDLRIIATRVGTNSGPAEMVETVRRLHRVFDRLASIPVVTLAELEGHALGGGLELALACDLRIASYSAKLGLPEAKVGLLPGVGGTQRLTELCGSGVAARVILSGDTIDGKEAEKIGLVQWGADKADFASAVEKVCTRVSSLSAPAIRAAKKCIRAAAPMQARGVAAEIGGIELLMSHPETAARVHAFLDGRA
jgi:enoyl-CoA hydratase/carnithine racemase